MFHSKGFGLLGGWHECGVPGEFGSGGLWTQGRTFNPLFKVWPVVVGAVQVVQR